MFTSISWSEFFNAILIAIGAYYGISILLFYSRDILSRIKNQSESKDEPLFNLADRSNLMGKAKQDAPKKHQQIIDAQDLLVDAVSKTNEGLTQSEDALLIGSVSDLLHEAKVLSRVIHESGGSREEGAPMFQSLLSNYQHLIGTKYQESISLFIQDQCKSQCAFEVSLDEVRMWWPPVEAQK